MRPRSLRPICPARIRRRDFCGRLLGAVPRGERAAAARPPAAPCAEVSLRADLAPLEARATFFHGMDEVGAAQRRHVSARCIALPFRPLSSPLLLTHLLLLLRRRVFGGICRHFRDGIVHGHRGERPGHQEPRPGHNQVRSRRSAAHIVDAVPAVCALRRLQARQQLWSRS